MSSSCEECYLSENRQIRSVAMSIGSSNGRVRPATGSEIIYLSENRQSRLVVMCIGLSDGRALCLCEGDDVWAHTHAGAISGTDTGLLATGPCPAIAGQAFSGCCAARCAAVPAAGTILLEPRPGPAFQPVACTTLCSRRTQHAAPCARCTEHHLRQRIKRMRTRSPRGARALYASAKCRGALNVQCAWKALI